jgi:N-acetylmuramoyl-L-alanine amidase
MSNGGKVVSTHFKRQSNKSTHRRLLSKVIIIVMLIILGCLIKNLLSNKVNANDTQTKTENLTKVEAKVVEQEKLKAEANITKAVLDVRASKSKRFVEEINNEIEYITLSESGKHSISHSRLNEDTGKIKKFFKKSNIEVNFDYTGIFSIPTSDIFMYVDDGAVHIEYDPDKIIVKSVETSNVTTQSDKALFGKEYSNQEVLSLLEIAKDDISKQLKNDSNLKTQSINNLNVYFTKVAKKLEIEELVINDETVIEPSYQFINNGTIAHNQPNEALNSAEFIIIHSTACSDITALQFYDTLNNAPTQRGTSCHFYIDDVNVVQAIATNLKSYNCGVNNDSGIDNNNSLSLEICEFTDPERQQKAIENASDFVKNVLLKEFPNCAVVAHRDAKATQCPRILSDEQFNQYFKEN